MKHPLLHRLATSLCIGMLVSLVHAGQAADAKTPSVGDPAPKVEGKTQDGDTWKLEDSLGKKVVLLYFYPKDDTPGCTTQACGLRDQMGDFKKENVEVIGVSFDSADSHREFIKKHDLNFTLIADTDGKIADTFGARMGPDRNIARRVTFLIGLDGNIKHVTDNRSADVHLTEMKNAVAKLDTK